MHLELFLLAPKEKQCWKNFNRHCAYDGANPFVPKCDAGQVQFLRIGESFAACNLEVTVAVLSMSLVRDDTMVQFLVAG
jgi:hypothetical protein